MDRVASYLNRKTFRSDECCLLNLPGINVNILENNKIMHTKTINLISHLIPEQMRPNGSFPLRNLCIYSNDVLETFLGMWGTLLIDQC